MFSLLKNQNAATPVATPAANLTTELASAPPSGWLARLRAGLRKTGASLGAVFGGSRIDEAWYEELETALLQADAGTAATAYVLEQLKTRVAQAQTQAQDPAAVKALLVQVLAQLLAPLQRPLSLPATRPAVFMVVGVNGAGKTTSIGKLTHHLCANGQTVLLAAADTFRAAAREQLAVWAERNQVAIISQQGADPGAVAFDAVSAARARGTTVVLVDTAGRLPTQTHLMEELRKIRRVLSKAEASAPHEILLVVDGNTGQNALAQIKAFDQALDLSGVIITKLDGSAKGGALCALALWARERQQAKPQARALAVYFVGVGESVDDLQAFKAQEFAQALLD